MCNPRRIVVTATRKFEEAWQREISQRVQLSEMARGEAVVRRPLGATLGEPTLAALDAVLAAEDSGWEELKDGEGYRFPLQGGYLTYHANDQTLEIVAQCQEEVSADVEGTAEAQFEISEEISADGEATVWDDYEDGRSDAMGEVEAAEDAEIKLDEKAAQLIERTRNNAVTRASAQARAQARAEARRRLARDRQDREVDLQRQAQRRLENLGRNARRQFNLALARAIVDAAEAYARSNHADNIQRHETDDVLQLEFMIQR